MSADAVDFRLNVLHGELIFRHQVHFVLKRANTHVFSIIKIHNVCLFNYINIYKKYTDNLTFKIQTYIICMKRLLEQSFKC